MVSSASVGVWLWQQNHLLTAALIHLGITLQAFGQWRFEQSLWQGLSPATAAVRQSE